MQLAWKTEYSRYRHYMPKGLGNFYQKKQNQAYTGLVLTLFTVSFFLFFAVKPTISTITTLIKSISDQRQVTQSLQQKIAALGKAQEEYNLLSPQLPLLNEALPEKPLLDLFSQQLEVIASTSNVTLTNLSFDSTPLKNITEGENSFNFSIAVEGDYLYLKSFLNNCLSLRRIIKIETFSFQNTTNNQTQTLRLNIIGKAFYFGPPNQNTAKVSSGSPTQ